MLKSFRVRMGLGAAVLLLALSAVLPVSGQPFSTQIAIAIAQLTTGVTPFTQLQNTASSYHNWGATAGTSGYGFRDNGGTMEWKSSGGSWTTFQAGSGAPTNASYWTRVAESGLSNETALGALTTGLIRNTTTTGVPVIYAGTSCTNQFPRSLDASGAATCATVALSTDTSGTLAVNRGGTGLTSGTSGGVLAFTASGTIASSAALTANALVLGGGAGAAPAALGSLGTTTTLLHGNAAGAPTFSAVSLTADVTGVLPAANGGTGQSSYAIGDLIYASGTTALSKLADVATGNVLLSGGVTTAPAYGKVTSSHLNITTTTCTNQFLTAISATGTGTCTTANLATSVTGTLPATNGGTGFASYTVGDLVAASSTTALAKINAVAVGQVLASAGTGTLPAYTADPQVSSVKLGANVALSSTAAAISSGFGTSPAIAGTAFSFRVTVGTGGTANTGVVTLPTAATAWNCAVQDLTSAADNDADVHTVVTASSTTSVTVENQTVSTGVVAAWTAADVLIFLCGAY